MKTDETKKSFLKLLCNLGAILFFIAALVAAHFIIEIAVAIMFAIFFYFLYTVNNLLHFKSKPSFLLITSVTIIIASSILLFCKPYTGHYIKYGVLFWEIILTIGLWFISSLKKKIKSWFIKKNQMKNLNLSIRLNELFLVTKLAKYAFTIHLLLVCIYKFYFINAQTPKLTHFLFSELNLYLASLIAFYEYIRINLLHNEMKMENWLPVVNENGSVIGKVAYSISKLSEKQFLHPVVRIALIHNNLLYLTKRAFEDRIEPEKLDFPFESFVNYGQSLDEAVQLILNKKVKFNDLNIKFAFKHIVKNSDTNRLIYLYTAQLQQLQQAGAINLTDGKWWTEKQIEENLGKGIFSDFFEMEYEILKNTILLANRTINQTSKEKKA